MIKLKSIKVDITQEVNSEVYKQLKKIAQTERDKLISELETEEEVKFEYSDEGLLIHGDKSLDAYKKLIKKLNDDSDYFKIVYPKEWENIDKLNDENIVTYKLDPAKHQNEYNLVVNKFNVANNFNGKVIEIHRVQNKKLYENYYFAKRGIERKYEGKVVSNYKQEQLCFHGTRNTDPSVVYSSTEGIDRRYTSAAAYGLGAYFAVYSNYSASGGYVHRRSDGRFQLFLCRVFPGVTTLSSNLERQNWSVLKVNPETGMKYDSVILLP